MLLVAAQFAGVLASFAKAAPGPSGLGSQVHHQHLHASGGPVGYHQGELKSSFTKHCCGLHASFAGMVCYAFAASCTRFVSADDRFSRHAPQAVSIVGQDLSLGGWVRPGPAR